MDLAGTQQKLADDPICAGTVLGLGKELARDQPSGNCWVEREVDIYQIIIQKMVRL